MYTKYLTDRGQRLAFIETHKAMEHKKDSEKEYQRTQKLLDSSEYRVARACILYLYMYDVHYVYDKFYVGTLFVDLYYYNHNREKRNYGLFKSIKTILYQSIRATDGR